LREVLADAPMLADEVYTAAKQAGITLSTLRRAKALEDIKVRRRHLDDKPSREWPWEWCLLCVSSPHSSPYAHTDEHLEHLEHLPTTSMTYGDSSRCASAQLEQGTQNKKNQLLALDALDAHGPSVGRHPLSEVDDYDEGVL